MKTIILFVIALTTAGLMSACATTSMQLATAQSPAQIATQICPQLQAVHDAFADTPGLLSTSDAAKLAAAEPIVARVCAAATTVPTKPDLQAVAADAVPVLLDVVEASTLPGQTKLQITLGVNLAQSVITQQLAAQASAPAASAAQ